MNDHAPSATVETLSDRDIADAAWQLLEHLGHADGLGGMEYRRRLLGQADQLRSDESEGPDSRVADYAAAARGLAETLRDVEGDRPALPGLDRQELHVFLRRCRGRRRELLKLQVMLTAAVAGVDEEIEQVELQLWDVQIHGLRE
jgi:hypothetical protein